MDLTNYQCAIEGYISDGGNLCLSFDSHELIEEGFKSILVIDRNNAEKFVLGLSSLLEEIQNGMV